MASSRYIVPIHYTREREHGCFFLLTSTAGDCPHAPAQPWRDLPWLYERGPFDASELSAFDGSDVPITRSAPPSTNRGFAGGRGGKGGLRRSRCHGTASWAKRRDLCLASDVRFELAKIGARGWLPPLSHACEPLNPKISGRRLG